MDTSLKTCAGYLSDEKFNDSETCLVFAVNSISCDAYGLAKDLEVKYPFVDVYSKRKHLYDLQRCVHEDRPTPGTIIEHTSSSENPGPHIIAAVTQYGIGVLLKENIIAQNIIASSRDRSLVAGLKEDTRENRLFYFRNSIESIIAALRINPNIARVVIPSGLGRTCVKKYDATWQEKYMPHIKEMKLKLKPFSIEVILLLTPTEPTKTNKKSGYLPKKN